MKKNYLKKLSLLFTASFLLCCVSAEAQTTLTYSYTGAIQNFTVPPCVTSLSIQAKGAEGGDGAGGIAPGLGADIRGVVTVVPGQVLKILVGQKYLGSNYGGGGSFVTDNSNNPLVIAGGGGGGSATGGVDSPNKHGQITTAGAPGSGSGGGTGGTAGSGGNVGLAFAAGGGGGLLTTGVSGWTTGTGGIAFILGGQGAPTGGGYGGGATGSGIYVGGGGGGYSGGGGATNNGNGQGAVGGGGGSFNAGSNQVNTIGAQTGNGLVVIAYVPGSPIIVNVSSPVICTGSNATLTANGMVSYTWSPVVSNSNSIVVSPTSTTIYSVSGSNASGCPTSTALTITVNNTPTVSATQSSTVVCAGKSVTLTGNGANTYAWTGGVTNNASYIPTATSDYTLTGTNACGTATALASVSVNPLPSITASANTPTICNGSNVTLNGGGSVSGYTWTSGVTNNVAFPPSSTNQYTVTGAAANGCTSTAVTGVTVLITPNVPPTASPTVICLGQTATLSAIGATGYTWTPGTALNTFSTAVSPPSATTYTLVRSNGACTSTMTISLGVNPLPNVSATASPTQICVGDPVTLNVIGGITYTWMPGGFNNANFQLFPNSPTNYTVTASTGSCVASTVVQLSVNPSPVVGINSSTTQVCAGGSVVLTASGNAANYSWQPGGSTANAITVNPLVPAIYTLTGTNAFNCSVQQTQLIIAYPLPVLNLSSSVPFVCAGNPAILTIQNATLSNVTYSWSSNTGTGSLTTVSPSLTTDYFAFGTNSVTGCSNTNTLTLSVFVSTFAVTGPTAICKGNSATFIASGGATGYSWTNVPGASNTTSIEVSPASSTNYIVVGTTGNCSSTLTVPLVVNNLPNVTASYVRQQICRLEFGTVTAVGATTYTWNTGETTPSISYNTLTVTTIFTVTGTDVNGCSKTTTVTQFVATCIGIDALSANANIGLTIYPNPSNGNFIINSEADLTISIVNALGQEVYTTEIFKDKKDITVSNLPNGIYFITGESNGVKVNKKIVIEK